MAYVSPSATAPGRIAAARWPAMLAALVLAILIAAPQLGLPSYLLALAIEIFIFSILTMSLNLLLGYTGLVSLGHAAFFAVGAYGAAIAANQLSTEIWLSTGVGVLTAALLAVPVGWLSIRLSGFYFLMITLAVAQMIFSVVFRWKWLTGGSDGLLVDGPTLFGRPVLVGRVEMYYFGLALFCLVWALLARIVNAPFGQVLVGIRENTRRMRAIGFDVRRVKLQAFVLSAALAGLAGTLNAQFNLFVGPDSAHWTQSASVLVMLLIGGVGTLAGPVIGVTILLLLQNWLSSYTEYWNLVLGLIFIVFISSAREGVYGLVTRAAGRLTGSGGGRCQ